MANRALGVLLAGLALVSVAFAPLTMAQAPARTGVAHRVVVLLEGLRNNHGQVIGALYTRPDVWLEEGHSAGDCRAPIRNGVARCEFTVTGTRVAFAGFHDEDSDGSFDRDFLGLPQEGYSFSNDVREPFGPPSFQAATFAPVADGFVVHARYGI